ncbi:MAG: hypothetical protein WAL45_15760 [Terracidiphilus sp.]
MKDHAFHLGVGCGSWVWGRLGCSHFLLGTIFVLGLVLSAGNPASAQAAPSSAPAPAAEQAPPAESAPAPESSSKTKKPEKPLEPCAIKNSGASMVATGGLREVSVLGVGETTRTAGGSAVQSKVCSRFMAINWYDRFVTGPEVMRFSPEQKFRLAVTNIINPFNLGTIVGNAGISVAWNSHSPYGPGVDGWAKLSGTNLTQDMTDQFFGTFLIPSITHTDPHYHRRPDLSVPHRIWHCVDQIFWQRDDNGGHTFNYSQIVAPVFDIGISNLYVPGLQTNLSADAERYAIGLATAPIDNFITEFLPSIASHIHTHAVFVQRVINHVALNPP